MAPLAGTDCAIGSITVAHPRVHKTAKREIMRVYPNNPLILDVLYTVNS